MNCSHRPPKRFGLCSTVVVLMCTMLASVSWAQRSSSRMPEVEIVADAAGTKLQVDGRDFMVFGMNWDYFPIGTNYAYNLWTESDEFIEAVLDREIPLMQNMGVNAIRLYVGIPPRWVRYIYEKYGMFVVLNHACARWGFVLDGVWTPSVDYSNPRLREAVRAEVAALVEEFHGTPGILMWLLGNENNYGLSWSSFEIEALPEGERNAARARHLYSMFEEITRAIKEIDRDRPVAMANGDLQYIDIIAEEYPSLDILGSNVYRGISARDLFQVVKDKLGIPMMFTEFGADAWNAKEMREDQIMQARYLLGQWQEIYEQSAGKGRVGNAVGGLVFQWTDGWWKYLQESRLDIHDTNASWPNGGYREDYVEGENNMNEEWWGITAKGPSDFRGLYQVYPRAGYYALQQAWRLNPYAPSTDLTAIRRHFGAISPGATELRARGDRANLLTESLDKVRVSSVRLEFETYNTGGARLRTPEEETPDGGIPAARGFDHLQSFYADVQARPNENVTGTLSLSILGHVPLNPIDEIFYENRGRPFAVDSDGATESLKDNERIKVYRGSVSWDDRWFHLEGFYRTGHFHWGYEGDFFGIYREAFYGENLDIYNGEAPVGFELAGKKTLDGLKFAIGPELWWGANPAYVTKYQRKIGRVTATAVVQDDLDSQSQTTTSTAVPVPPTNKAALALQTTYRGLGIEVGGIWAGDTKNGQKFQIAEKDGDGYRILQDEVERSDNWGVKGKLTYSRGRWNWYGQAAYMGIVADGGPTQAITYTGWSLKDTGSGNQANVMTGFTVGLGNKFQFAPNVLYQKPLVGPIPGEVVTPGRPRNILDDPFSVRANREMFGAELLLVWDPTPATWFWMWDSDVREDAKFAASLNFVYRDLRTTQDASIGILEDGRTTFAFPGATPPRDLWELKARIASRMRTNARLVAHLYGGTGEPNGDDPRRIRRFGGDARLTWGSLSFSSFARFNDWGPYDYHKDFNLTFPVQLMGDVSYALGSPRWFDFPQTKIGFRGTWRTLDEHSPRYCPGLVPDPAVGFRCDPLAPGEDGREWEIRTYLHFAL